MSARGGFLRHSPVPREELDDTALFERRRYFTVAKNEKQARYHTTGEYTLASSSLLHNKIREQKHTTTSRYTNCYEQFE